MDKPKVYNSVITDRSISNHAFYLYIELQRIRANPKNEFVYVYSHELLDGLMWKTKKTLKKYMKELKDYGLIDYDFDDFPINRSLKIKMLHNEENKYTQVDNDLVSKIKELGKNVFVKWTETNKKTGLKQIHEKHFDLKEASMRLYYLMAFYYMSDSGEAFPSYITISEKIPISPRYIKAINTMFDDNNIINVVIGKRHNTDNRRSRNSYRLVLKENEKQENQKQN